LGAQTVQQGSTPLLDTLQRIPKIMENYYQQFDLPNNKDFVDLLVEK